MNTLIEKPEGKINCRIALSGSKSISNRVLIIRAIGNLNLTFYNLSDAEDTRLLEKALLSIGKEEEINVNHAGTAFRFLTALLASRSGTHILTGSDRLQQRPVGDLVEVLRTLGAEIEYLGEEGYPPLRISGKPMKGGSVSIRGDVSSQFISALLLVAPTFSDGLQLSISTPLVSKPYVDMTIGLMREFGTSIKQNSAEIQVLPSKYRFKSDIFNVEGDWSSAGYWFSIASLSPGSEIRLANLSSNSYQADSALGQLYTAFSVDAYTEGKDLVVQNTGKPALNSFTFNFRDCPDSAQTVAVTCAVLGIKANLTGLQTLKIKETDRITALKNELRKFGIRVEASEDTIRIAGKVNRNAKEMVNTYHDHRMALCFAPLSLVTNTIKIEDHLVIQKSYPSFWKDLATAGFTVTETD